MKLSLVTTTINPNAQFLTDNVELFKSAGQKSYIILDRKNASISDDCYINLRDMPLNEFEQLVPFDNYARKNIGFVRAFQNNENVFETDDDNLITLPISHMLKILSQKKSKCYTSVSANLFASFYRPNDTTFWARGLPLKYRNANPAWRENGDAQVGVTQFLVSGSPDLDAIYRLVIEDDSHFLVNNDELPRSIKDTYHPFNSQGTLWRKEFLPLAYLPSYCEFRMTDIWRGYVAQHILYSHGYSLNFEKEGLRQVRNEHDIAIDFVGEHQGYVISEKVISEIKATQKDSFEVMLMTIYEKLIRVGAIYDKRELVLLQSYLECMNANDK